MAPRQRISPPHEELAAAAAAEVAKPLIRTSSAATHAAEIERARENHDMFNLVALLFVVFGTLVNWDFRQIASGPGQAWTGNYFYQSWATTICYFLLDLIWVARVPICVKSPDVIIKHHFVAIAYLSGPLAWPEYRWFMGACLSVEINTWFLILRRVLYKRQDRISPVIREVVSMCFYASWLLIRVVIYPAIMILFCRMARERVLETDKLWHWPMMFIPVHFFLCVLNLKWTYDLFQPIIAKQLSSSSSRSVESNTNGISSGL